MHAKSLITAALAITAATSLVVITSRPTWADPAAPSVTQESLEQRVKSLEAEVKQLRNELKELKAARAGNLERLPIIGEYFKQREGKGDSDQRSFFFHDGMPSGEWEKFLKDSAQKIEVDTKDGKTTLKIQKPGEKSPRVYVLPDDKAKLEKEFPHMKFMGADGMIPHRLGMVMPRIELDSKAMAGLEKHLKELGIELGKEFGPEFSAKLRKELENARKAVEKENAQREKANKDIPPSGYDPEESDSISI